MSQDDPSREEVSDELYERMGRATIELLQRKQRGEAVNMNEFLEGHFLNSERKLAEQVIQVSNILSVVPKYKPPKNKR